MKKALVFWLCLVFLTGCGGSNDFTAVGGSSNLIAQETPLQRNGVSEKDLVEEPGLALLVGQVGLLFMEPDAGAEGSVDTGESGVDILPIRLVNAGLLELRFGANLAGVVDLITLHDSNGTELARVAPCEETVSVFLEPGVYTLRFNSADDRTDDENRAVFSVFDRGSAPSKEVMGQEASDFVLAFTSAVENRNLDAMDLSFQTVFDLDITNCSLRGANWSDAKLFLLIANGADLSGLDGGGVSIAAGQFNQTNFSGADFEAATFVNCLGVETNFQETNLNGATFGQCVFPNANFQGASLVAEFIRSALPEASFLDATFRSTTFFECILKKADFTGSNVSEVKFINSDLTGTTIPKG